MAWNVLTGFLRLSDASGGVCRPAHGGGGARVIEGWLAQPCVTVVRPTDRHMAVLREIVTSLGTAGNLTSDPHLAALAIEHGAELCSTHTDFARFTGGALDRPVAVALGRAARARRVPDTLPSPSGGTGRVDVGGRETEGAAEPPLDRDPRHVAIGGPG
jgi:hypothetical protein